MSNILLSGYYGFGNLGDEAILQGLITTLQNQGHKVTVLSADPQLTNQSYNLPAKSRYLGLLPALLGTDVLISGGGGLLQDKTSYRSLQYYLGSIRLAKALGKKVMVYGQSIGPLSERGKQEVAKVLKGIPVAVRDTPSQELLQGMGITAELVADAAFLLEAPTPGEPMVDVLLIPRAHYPDLQEGLHTLAQDLLERGFKVGVTTIQPNEDIADLESLLALGCDDFPAPSVPELLDIISHSSYVVSGRLHGLILASLVGVHFCGLIYDPKVRAFLNEMQAPGFELPVHRGGLLETVLEQPPISIENMAAMKARAQAGVQWLERHIAKK
jgi:polysaccharide pyruvyl transferase CsaB